MPLESPLAYNMYLFHFWIANHILINKVYLFKLQIERPYKATI